MTNETTTRHKAGLRGFPRLFWLAIIFEFFERGSYYGMMSVLAVYLTDVLSFPKQDAGVVLGVIQPILYFLPILAGALADRFGYRRALTVAFSLLGTGYFLTSQATSYAAVFASLVVMALGAGTFKPIISGTIARTTDETNSSVAFGIYYWTINLGAFLFPLIVVPALKHGLGWRWIFVASALGTGSMLLPTLLLFHDPPLPEKDRGTKTAQRDGDPQAGQADGTQDQRVSPGLLDTLSSAFEIIYSPVVLFWSWAGRRRLRLVVAVLGLAGVLGLAAATYVRRSPAALKVRARSVTLETPSGQRRIVVELRRDRTEDRPFRLHEPGQNGTPRLVLHWTELEAAQRRQLARALSQALGAPVDEAQVDRVFGSVANPKPLQVGFATSRHRRVALSWTSEHSARLLVQAPGVDQKVVALALQAASTDERLRHVDREQLEQSLQEASHRSLSGLFVALLLVVAVGILALRGRLGRGRALWPSLGLVVAMLAGLWLVPSATTFSRVVCTVLGLSVLSLLRMDTRDRAKYVDHVKFLSLLVVYSGFWVMYFQMFGSVLWYVKAYVDATPLSEAVSSITVALGMGPWRFDVEHVTVVNAGTIILLQLLISKVVQRRRALPTMIAGILAATAGMAILALSSTIWVFLAGIVLFSIGEMTAHPKFISFVGLTAPREKVAMYMGYVFLYGVIGSSVGSILGSRLYVDIVDHRDAPQVLWLIFAGIGVATVLGLVLYSRLIQREEAH